MLFKTRLIVKEMRNTHEIPMALLEELDFKLIEGTLKKEVLKEARERRLRDIAIKKRIQIPFQRFERHAKMLHYKGHNYILLRIRELHILLQNTHTVWSCCTPQMLVFLGMLILLVVMYVLLRKSLIPLKVLQEDIVKYGEGKEISPRYSDKKDEVSMASNAFYDSVKKLDRLRDSRQLFIRNLFHELNTPVTKGKILAEVVEERKTQEMLYSIFTRLSILLKELAQMEKITSQSFTVQLKPIRIKELIDEASDLLYLDDEIPTNITDEMIEADFSLMSIVFKNLIDNALKYGSDLNIQAIHNRILFRSVGEPLKHGLSHYTLAFSKGEELGADKGFGLGLYIVYEILSKHNMRLGYDYQNGTNEFSIEVKNNL